MSHVLTMIDRLPLLPPRTMRIVAMLLLVIIAFGPSSVRTLVSSTPAISVTGAIHQSEHYVQARGKGTR